MTAAPGLRLVAAIVGIGMVAAACSSAASPAWTYSPVAQPTSTAPAMDMSPSAGPLATPALPPASAGAVPPSTPAAPAGSPQPVAVLHISAQNLAFDTNQLQAPAGQAFVIAFDNNDPGIPHNLEITDADGTSVFKGQIVTGPTTVSYQIPALAAGTYMFECDVHPFMNGTLTAS